MKNWFKNVSNIEELKKEYRKLAKQYHPDMSKEVDTHKIFVEIVAQYDKLFAILKKNAKTKSNNNSDNSQNMSNDDEKHAFNSDFKAIIDKLVQFDALNIEIVGTWVWVSGDTYNYRQIIKEMGFKWSGSNKKWYWHEGDMSKVVKKATSWSYKVEKYGCDKLTGKKNAKIGN
jgi:DnaJ-class molecular chaperone